MALRGRLQIAHLDNWLLDAEHGQMIHLIEIVESAIVSSQDEIVIRDAFDRLITWTVKHFAHENDHMLYTRFHAAQDHIAHHHQLIDMLKGFVTANSDENIGVPDAMQFLEDWLVHHIETDDRVLADFLASRTPRWRVSKKSDGGA